MAELAYLERTNIEKFLGMKSGFVLDFSDRTFQNFVGDAVGLDINDTKYHFASNSKANRLRQFMKVETDFKVGTLLSALCDYWHTKVRTNQIDAGDNQVFYDECIKIAERLKQGNIVEYINAIQPNSDDKDFKFLAKEIKASIEKNQPEAALDRLHTFTVRYIRELCDKHKIVYDKAESLNAVFGKYVKHLVDKKIIESTMAERILKYSINIIEAFNDIRNNKSFAHDNAILNYHESILIFNNISNLFKFIDSIENKTNCPDTSASNEPDLEY